MPCLPPLVLKSSCSQRLQAHALTHSLCIARLSTMLTQVRFCPSNPNLFASASGDHTLKLWDASVPHSVQTIPAHEHEILTLDWNKYNPNMLATGKCRASHAAAGSAKRSSRAVSPKLTLCAAHMQALSTAPSVHGTSGTQCSL